MRTDEQPGSSPDPMNEPVDPIRLELIKNALEMISDNMMVSVLRTSRSTLVKANMDCSASSCDAEGTMVAQGLAVQQRPGNDVLCVDAEDPIDAQLLLRYRRRVRQDGDHGHGQERP